MNTERLHSLLRLLIKANNKHNFVDLLQNFENAYTQSVQTPSPENADAFNNALNALRATAHEFPVGSLSPSRRKILEAIGGATYYGEGLALEIDHIIAGSDTPSNAVVEIQNLRSKVNEFFPTIQALDDSLNKLGVGTEDVPKDSAEIEILIPEEMVEGHLNGLVKETRHLDTALSDIREVVTGKRASLDIRSLGSGSLELYLTVDLVTGAYVLNFITGVVLLINSILQTRRDRESLKLQDAPKQIIKEIKNWEDKRITDEIDKLRDEILEKYKGEEGRKNELRNALSNSLKRLADRIDRGMDIDVTTAATVGEKGGEEATGEVEQIKAERRSIESIQKDANIISQIERNRAPVLQLPDIEERLEPNKNTKLASS